MDLVIVSHLEPILCGERCYLFKMLVTIFCKQIIVSRNKPTKIAMSSVCGFEQGCQIGHFMANLEKIAHFFSLSL